MGKSEKAKEKKFKNPELDSSAVKELNVKIAPIKDGYDFNSPVSGSITSPISVSIADPKGVLNAEWSFGDGTKASGLSASYQ